MPAPIRTLPDDYVQAQHLVLTGPRLLILLNLAALVLLVPAGAGLNAWWLFAQSVRGAQPGAELNPLVGVALLLVTLLVHEAFHGIGIAATGHRPRFGARLDKGVLYATADGAYFRRGEFILIALLPLVGLTLVFMLALWAAPDSLAFWLIAAGVINISGAVGDMWMTAAVLRYAPDALVQDEADSIRIFARR